MPFPFFNFLVYLLLFFSFSLSIVGLFVLFSAKNINWKTYERNTDSKHKVYFR